MTSYNIIVCAADVLRPEEKKAIAKSLKKRCSGYTYRECICSSHIYAPCGARLHPSKGCTCSPVSCGVLVYSFLRPLHPGGAQIHPISVCNNIPFPPPKQFVGCINTHFQGVTVFLLLHCIGCTNIPHFVER